MFTFFGQKAHFILNSFQMKVILKDFFSNTNAGDCKNMGQQHRRVVKRQRRKAYLDRQKAKVQVAIKKAAAKK